VPKRGCQECALTCRADKRSKRGVQAFSGSLGGGLSKVPSLTRQSSFHPKGVLHPARAHASNERADAICVRANAQTLRTETKMERDCQPASDCDPRSASNIGSDSVLMKFRCRLPWAARESAAWLDRYDLRLSFRPGWCWTTCASEGRARRSPRDRARPRQPVRTAVRSRVGCTAVMSGRLRTSR